MKTNKNNILKLSTVIALFSLSNAFAFGINLQDQGKMTIQQLTDLGVDYVQCEQQSPKCILQGKKFGIQYPDQKLEEVILTEDFSVQVAISTIKKLKREGLCQ